MAKIIAGLLHHPFAFPTSMEFPAYCYNVVDGDTIDVLIALPFDRISYQRIRVKGVNTPEKGQPGFDFATRFTESLVQDKQIKLVSYKDTKTFDRYVADVFFMGDIGWVSLAEELKRKGY